MKLKYSIEVYNSEGKDKILEFQFFCQLVLIKLIRCSEFGNILANGVYLYKVIAIKF